MAMENEGREMVMARVILSMMVMLMITPQFWKLLTESIVSIIFQLEI